MTTDRLGARAAMRAALRILRALAVLAMDSICRLVPRARGKCVLVMRLDAIGDFFIWMQSGAVDVAEYAKTLGSPTVLLANSSWADYARSTGLWHDVHPVEAERFVRDPLYRARELCGIRRMGIATLIQPRSARVLLLEDAIARASGATWRIGNRGTLLNMRPGLRRLGDRFYDKLIEVRREGVTHETVLNDQFVLGLTGRRSTHFDFRRGAHPTVADTVVVVPGAGEIGRVWPMEKLAAVVRHIRHRYPGLRIVLMGLPVDIPAAQTLIKLVGDSIENEIGRTSLRSYVETIATARLIICNESSAYHIAMAYRRDVLCFLGGGHYGWFAPYPRDINRESRAITQSVAMNCFNCNWACQFPRTAQGTFRCVDSISVDTAIASVEALLEVRRTE